MRARVKWIEGVAWMAEADSGHGLVIDGSPAIGGRNLGPRPMELVLAGLGGCTAMDVIEILRKQRQDVTDCVIDVEAERAETVPKVFTRIQLHYTVTGRALKPAAVERAVKLSAEKYCSVSAMLQSTASIDHAWTVVEADDDAAD
ncbi:MAG: OsmC family protein [Myxococcales bacterium]|nr:OsmC family protein [Myxococcales bacterium]